MGMYAYWGNLPVVAGIIFQTLMALDGLVILIYFTYHRNYLVRIFEMLEAEFLPYIMKVGRYHKQDTIMSESSKFAKKMNKSLMIITAISLSAWGVFPFFVKQWSHDPEKELAINTTGQKHF